MSDNEDSPTQNSNENTKIIDDLLEETNFSTEQIENFRKYFQKCKIHSSNNGQQKINDNYQCDSLNKEEFKYSLGVLGTKSCDYISNRLFEVISTQNTDFISFRDYILYLDLVNYGSKENKLKFCFRFFDLGNKGYITNKDFTNIMYNLCIFLSSLTVSQVLIEESELSNLYNYYIEKANVDQLDFFNFKVLLNNFPGFLDFYDIFNNNIYYEMNFFIKKENLDKIIEIKEKIFKLRNLLANSQLKNSSVSLVTDEYIDDVLELKKKYDNILSNESSFINISQNNLNITNYNNTNIKKLNLGINDFNNFSLSDYLLNSHPENQNVIKNLKKINKKSTTSRDYSQSMINKVNQLININDCHNYSETFPKKIENDSSLDLSESSEDSGNNINLHKSILSSKNILQKSKSRSRVQFEFTLKKPKKNGENCNNINDLKKKKKKFRFLKPFTEFKDLKLPHYLKKYGYDLEDTLIVTDKSDFEYYLDDILNSLGELIFNILPQNLRAHKRLGIFFGENFEFDLGKFRSVKVVQDNEIQKNIIHFGNPNLKLVINIMIGIKSAVSKIGQLSTLLNSINSNASNNYNPILFPVDNLSIYEETNRFIYEQNNYDNITKCKFYDFAPKIFYNLRNLYGISNDDYLKSLGPENFLCNLIITKNKSLKEICSSGKSGSFFYYSYDSKYLMKTIPESEFEKFKGMLKDYYLYMLEHPNTLLQRFFGLYICIFNDVKMYFVVMNNVFNTPLQIHYKYDLKGSTYKRISRKCKEINYDKYDFDIALKDIDFVDRNENIDISTYDKQALYSEACNDSKFLSDHNINDYSFLIGVHDQHFKNNNLAEDEMLLVVNKQNSLTNVKTLHQVKNAIKARKPFYETYLGGIQSEDNTKVYFFGIIDIFTNFGASKKVEYVVKSVSQGTGISCKPPNQYSKRFINCVKTVLKCDGWDNKNN